MAIPLADPERLRAEADALEREVARMLATAVRLRVQADELERAAHERRAALADLREVRKLAGPTARLAG